MTQPATTSAASRKCCELLSNLYLCIGWHSAAQPTAGGWGVVNCFQICIFVSDDTAQVPWLSIIAVLWIAFKFVSLYRMTQLSVPGKPVQIGCELLSNLYLCIGWHSQHQDPSYRPRVVNCFQICIFVSDDTADLERCRCPHRLWIAFKFVSLYRMTQQASQMYALSCSCELLSNLYLCIGWHSQSHAKYIGWTVVNCFQICIFVSDDTADYIKRTQPRLLWIAFKFVSLYRMTQPAGQGRPAG